MTHIFTSQVLYNHTDFIVIQMKGFFNYKTMDLVVKYEINGLER